MGIRTCRRPLLPACQDTAKGAVAVAAVVVVVVVAAAAAVAVAVAALEPAIPRIDS
jgi:hypothetical protein